MARPSKRQALWSRQRGLCPVCGRSLPVRGSHRHHVRPGSSRLADLELLHPRCHLKHRHGRGGRRRTKRSNRP